MEYELFFKSTFREVDFILKAKSKALNEKYEVKRLLGYEFASLVMIGFHNPKKFPSYDELKDGGKKGMSDEQFFDLLRSMSKNS